VTNLKKFNLSEMQKGIIYMVVGAIILLYAFNFFKAWLNTLVILGGIFLLAYGFLKIGGVDKIRSLIGKK
jgi:hypothetical protein